MEPITTALAAVSAASNAIAFIKARINDVQSVADISDQIGTLFNAQKKLNEERNKQAGVGDITFKGSIDAVLESKRLAEEMQQVATLINMRWPNQLISQAHGRKYLIIIIRHCESKKRRKRKRSVRRLAKLASLRKRLKARYSSPVSFW
jgi:hypothetical protein